MITTYHLFRPGKKILTQSLLKTKGAFLAIAVKKKVKEIKREGNVQPRLNFLSLFGTNRYSAGHLWKDKLHPW